MSPCRTKARKKDQIRVYNRITVQMSMVQTLQMRKKFMKSPEFFEKNAL